MSGLGFIGFRVCCGPQEHEGIHQVFFIEFKVFCMILWGLIGLQVCSDELLGCFGLSVTGGLSKERFHVL